MTRTKIAAIQMTSVDDVATNIAAAGALLRAASAQGARLAVLPENFAFMAADESRKAGIAEADGSGPIQDFLAATARELRLWIVGGTIPLRSDDPERPYAACVVWNDAGERAGRYDKIHLFDVRVPESNEAYRESRRTTPGRDALVLDTPLGRLGVAVCYDLRFPELFRAMLDPPLDVVALPAAFTYRTGQAHWHTLLRARAIENLCYVVAPAQVGRHSANRLTYGNAMIVDPWGTVLARCPDGEGVCVAQFSRARMERARQELPSLKHRRL